MSPSLDRPPWLEALEGARTVLVAGAGGGFDLYSGLPLALWLEAQGKSAIRLRLRRSTPYHVTMTALKAVLFDLDDTLWDVRPVLLRAEDAMYR